MQLPSFSVFKHCHIAASSFHLLKTLLVGSDSWLGSLIALIPLHFCINSFPITVWKINFLSLFVKFYSVYLHPIRSSSAQWFASIFLHAYNAWFDPLFFVYSKHKHLTIPSSTSWKPPTYCLWSKGVLFPEIIPTLHLTYCDFCLHIFPIWFSVLLGSYLNFKTYSFFLNHVLTNILNMNAFSSIAYFF